MSLAPAEMAVHSTPSSSDKPGHDPPETEKRMSGEASRSRRDNIQSGQIRRGAPLDGVSSEYAVFLTSPSSSTEWNSPSPFLNGNHQRHSGIAGSIG